MKNIYPQIRKEALKLTTEIRKIAEQLGRVHNERLEEGIDILENGKLFVVVCGEFKRGKSSLINSLLEIPELCPVDIDITTAVVTLIEWHQKEEIIVVHGEAGFEKYTKITRDQINEYVNEQYNKKNEKQVRQLIIRGPFSQLKDGLVIIDTPGLGGLHSEHAAMTYDIIPKSQVAIFVMAVDQPLTKRELNFVKKWLTRYCKRIIYVVTGIDHPIDYRRYIKDTRIKLAETIGCSLYELTIIPVSNILKIDYLTSKDQDDLLDSNYQELENAIWNRLNAEAVFILLTSVIESILWSLSDLHEPLEAQEMYFDKQQRNKILIREKEIIETKSRLKELQEDCADWVSDLQRDFQLLEADILSKLNLSFHDIQLISFNRIRDGADQEQMITLVLENVMQVGYDLDSSLDRKISDLYLQLRNKTSVGIDNIFPLFPSINLPSNVINLPITPPHKESFAKRSWEYFIQKSKALMGRIPYIGKIFFPLGTTMTKEARAHAHLLGKVTPEDLQLYSQNQTNKAKEFIQTELKKKILLSRDGMIKHLKNKLRQEEVRCKNVLADLESAKSVPDQEIKPKLDAVRDNLRKIAAMRSTAEELFDSIEGQRESALQACEQTTLKPI